MVLLTQSHDVDDLLESIRAGAVGYVPERSMRTD